MPLGIRTSNRGVGLGDGVCPSRQSVHSNARTLAFVSRAKGNSNLFLKFTEPDCAKSVPCASDPTAASPSVDPENFEVAALRIVVQLQCKHVPDWIDGIRQIAWLLF
jgi:hypothetical protein